MRIAFAAPFPEYEGIARAWGHKIGGNDPQVTVAGPATAPLPYRYNRYVLVIGVPRTPAWANLSFAEVPTAENFLGALQILAVAGGSYYYDEHDVGEDVRRVPGLRGRGDA